MILWFQCENQVEDLEDTILEIFAEEGENRDIELCSQRWDLILFCYLFEPFYFVDRSKYCEAIESPPEEYAFENDELWE